MAYQNQIKNIVYERQRLAFKQISLERQLLSVKKEMKSLDQQNDELWEAQYQEELMYEQVDDYADDYDDDCVLRKRKTKKIGKGFTLKHSHRKDRIHCTAGMDKKRSNKSRAGKQTDRSRSHLHQERDYGEILHAKEDQIIAAYTEEWDRQDDIDQLIAYHQDEVARLDAEQRQVDDDNYNSPDQSDLSNYNRGRNYDLGIGPDYSDDEQEQEELFHIRRKIDAHNERQNNIIIDEYIEHIGMSVLEDMSHEWIKPSNCNSNPRSWGEYILGLAVEYRNQSYTYPWKDLAYGSC